jgi:hypothetical protein
MLILIPVDSDNKDEAQITLLNNVKKWALLDFGDGKVKQTTFYDTFEEIDDFIEVVIVKDQSEYVWTFEERNIAVLVAPMQTYIDDIMEAFIFKELHDFNISGVNKA